MINHHLWKKKRVQLIVSCIFDKPSVNNDLNVLNDFLVTYFGEILEILSPAKMLNEPTSYKRELGDDLYTVIYVFRSKFTIHELIDIKKIAIIIEGLLATNGRRKYNINPGFISQDGLFLLSHKRRRRRSYLGRGVWLEKQLMAQYGKLSPMPYTFPEFLERNRIKLLSKYVREMETEKAN